MHYGPNYISTDLNFSKPFAYFDNESSWQFAGHSQNIIESPGVNKIKFSISQ